MNGDTYFRTILALLFVLGLVLACSWVLRRYTRGGMSLNRGARRLAVIDAVAIDPKRRLVLIRRDGTEHLLLLSPNRDVVIEASIQTPIMPESFAAELAGTRS